jgi:hypothetical protein
VLVNESSLNNSYRWKEYTFRNATLLTPSQRLCIVVPQVSGGTAGEASYEDAGITLLDHAMLVSDNQGATWSIASDKALHFRVRGTYFTPSGSLHTVTRNYVTGIQVTLRTGAGGESRVISQIPLLNSPEFLAGFWKLDFNEDPRSVDYNCDGLGDWTENTGSNGFDPESLVDGVWQANAADQVALRTQPNFDFTSLTTVEVRCRSTSFNASGYGAHFLIHVDRSGSTSGVIFTSVRLEANGSQSARVYVKPDADTETTIAEVTGLSTAFVEFRLVIDPSVDLVAVWINDTYRSTWQYQRFVNTNDHFFLAQASESNAEFDYISVRAN